MKRLGRRKAAEELSGGAGKEQENPQLGLQCAHAIVKCGLSSPWWPPYRHPNYVILNEGGINMPESQVSANNIAEEGSERRSAATGIAEIEGEDGIVSEGSD